MVAKLEHDAHDCGMLFARWSLPESRLTHRDFAFIGNHLCGLTGTKFEYDFDVCSVFIMYDATCLSQLTLGIEQSSAVYISL